MSLFNNWLYIHNFPHHYQNGRLFSQHSNSDFLKTFLGFEPTTSMVPSQCTTNWATQAWINKNCFSLIFWQIFRLNSQKKKKIISGWSNLRSFFFDIVRPQTGPWSSFVGQSGRPSHPGRKWSNEQQPEPKPKNSIVKTKAFVVPCTSDPARATTTCPVAFTSS